MTLPALPAVHPLGEGAWTVALGGRADPTTHQRVLALAARIAAANLTGVEELVPAYTALTVFFDPGRADANALRDRVFAFASGLPDLPASRPPDRPAIVIPVRYDGPDLDEVAGRVGLTHDEVIRRHSSREYQVYLLGFAPGFAYLGELDPALVLPRRAEPRVRVPPGSVAIAAAQTAIYPLATPGGWHLIGTTLLRMFDPAREPPAVLTPGDRVRFDPLP